MLFVWFPHVPAAVAESVATAASIRLVVVRFAAAAAACCSFSKTHDIVVTAAAESRFSYVRLVAAQFSFISYFNFMNI